MTTILFLPLLVAAAALAPTRLADVVGRWLDGGAR